MAHKMRSDDSEEDEAPATKRTRLGSESIASDLQRQLNDAQFHIRRLQQREVQYKMCAAESEKAKIFRRQENAELRQKLAATTARCELLEAAIYNDDFNLTKFELTDLPISAMEAAENAILKIELEKSQKKIIEQQKEIQSLRREIAMRPGAGIVQPVVRQSSSLLFNTFKN